MGVVDGNSGARLGIYLGLAEQNNQVAECFFVSDLVTVQFDKTRHVFIPRHAIRMFFVYSAGHRWWTIVGAA